MAVTSSDIKFFKAAATTGGRRSSTSLADGAKHALFPAITPEQLTAGGSRIRKLFAKNENAEGLGWTGAGPYIKTVTQADDYLRIILGDSEDDATDAAAYTDWAGAGDLASAASPGDVSITVDYDAADGVWDGATIVLTEGTVREQAVVSGAPAWTGNQAVLTLASGLTGSFSAGAVVSTVPDTETVKGAISSWIETLTGTAAYDEAQAVAPNVGAVTDSWTLTFTDNSGSFSVSGAYSGAIGTGSTAVDFEPTNGSGYYIQLPAAGWSGDTPALGDTITWNTQAAEQAVWVKNIWAASTTNYAGNAPELAWIGASE